MAEGWQQSSEGSGEELYLCPLCSTRVSASAKECPNCRAVFVEDGAEEARAPPAPSPAGEVSAVQYKCPNCDEVVTETDPKCPSCGAIFIDTAPPPPPAAPAPAAAPGAEAAMGAPAAAPAAAGARPTATKRRRGPSAKAAAARMRRHSKAVELLAVRRKRIAQRRALGLTSMGAGMVVYLVALVISGSSGMTALAGFAMGAGIVLLAVGILIYYNQHIAWQHYQQQLENARAEAALLKELAKDRGRRAPPAARERPAARATPSKPPVEERAWTEGPVAGAAQAAPTVDATLASTAPSTPVVTIPPSTVSTTAASRITVEVAPTGPDEKDKVPCPNCGYMNRRIFVRCIRCGTELQKREPTIAVETFERPEPRVDAIVKEPIRGGAAVVPWEAKRASSTQATRAAARAAERKAALAEAEATATAKNQDRRAVIGVAANFTKLPREMRESLIRTLFKVDDPVVRQDVVSAIAENYTELPRDIQELLAELADDEDARVREEVAFEVNRNFDRIPLGTVQSVFSKLARDPERMVREDVVSSIAENFQRLPKESQDLLKVLAQDRIESVRDEVSFEIAKNSDVIPEKFKSEIMEIIKRAGGA